MINSVTGATEVSADTVVLPHEHAVIDYGQMAGRNSNITESDVEAMILQFQTLAHRGVGVFVDCTPPGYGRDIALLQRISRDSGVLVVASTGTFCEEWNDLPSFVYQSSVDELASFFTSELNTHCGVIKVATSYGVMRATEKKAFQAAAIAHANTGAPIVAHTTGSLGPEQVNFLISHGVESEKILVSHVCAANEPPEYAIAIASLGAYVGFDRIGHAAHNSDHWLDLMETLLDQGLSKQVLISHDSALRFEGPEAIASHTFSESTHIFDGFRSEFDARPALSGLFSDLTTTNPLQWLTR